MPVSYSEYLFYSRWVITSSQPHIIYPCLLEIEQIWRYFLWVFYWNIFWGILCSEGHPALILWYKVGDPKAHLSVSDGGYHSPVTRRLSSQEEQSVVFVAHNKIWAFKIRKKLVSNIVTWTVSLYLKIFWWDQ